MKKLIVYTSKTGTTEKCIKNISEKLKDITIVNLDKSDIDINEYDLIIIGTPIRMGMINKKVKKFINKNFRILINKKVAYFICGGFNENWKQYYEQNIRKELLNKAITYISFGGELDLEKQKGIDKFIVKMVNKNMNEKNKVELIEKNIDLFIKKLQKFN